MKGDKQSNIGNSRRLLCYAAFPDHLMTRLPVQMKKLDGLYLIHDLCSTNATKIVCVA
jgi:hypothetical protein